ncbi:hypothetical protein ElyMa_001604000 [Elysia marginata]|uniref:Corticotropin-releasing factor domain-containing protein n=1 Tax=Elysia marginata TaxID=1093978 RepID=A0AAV4JK49_9GAST|nr:hypothetical protein ElyMa_001604000 [Elysia marginata]
MSVFDKPRENYSFVRLRKNLVFAVLVVALATGRCDSDVNTTRLQEVMTTLARQTMMQQLVMEERIRSSGHSGIKQV